jgi:hypothetical protein
MKREECSETSAYKSQTPGNYPEENIQHTEHGESVKSRIYPSSFACEVIRSFGLVTPEYICCGMFVGFKVRRQCYCVV